MAYQATGGCIGQMSGIAYGVSKEVKEVTPKRDSEELGNYFTGL